MTSEVIELSTSDCELLLASLDIGRIAVVDDGFPLVFPCVGPGPGSQDVTECSTPDADLN